MKNRYALTNDKCRVLSTRWRKIKEHGAHFYIEKNETEGNVYHWIDSDISVYSNRKLWDLIRLSETDTLFFSGRLAEAIRKELMLRNQYLHENPWQVPH